MSSGQDFTTLTPPGTTPKITSIYDFSAEALGQLKFWLEQSGLNIPISQVLGFSQFTAQEGNTIVTPTETTTSTSYVDLTTVGPTITGLPDGRYVIFFGNTSSTSLATAQATTSVQVNATAASDNDMLLNGSTVTVPVARAILKDLNNGGGNTITMKYKAFAAGTASFRDRWMIALKIANL